MAGAERALAFLASPAPRARRRSPQPLGTHAKAQSYGQEQDWQPLRPAPPLPIALGRLAITHAGRSRGLGPSAAPLRRNEQRSDPIRRPRSCRRMPDQQRHGGARARRTPGEGLPRMHHSRRVGQRAPHLSALAPDRRTLRRNRRAAAQDVHALARSSGRRVTEGRRACPKRGRFGPPHSDRSPPQSREMSLRSPLVSDRNATLVETSVPYFRTVSTSSHRRGGATPASKRGPLGCRSERTARRRSISAPLPNRFRKI